MKLSLKKSKNNHISPFAEFIENSQPTEEFQPIIRSFSSPRAQYPNNRKKKTSKQRISLAPFEGMEM